MSVASSRTRYIVLHDYGAHQQRVSLENSVENCVASWTSGSRLSPCWAIKDNPASTEKFSGNETLLFLGPLQPAELFTSIKGLIGGKGIGIWVTAGCFNVLIRIPKRQQKMLNSVESWLEAKRCAREKWTLKDGVIESVEWETYPERTKFPELVSLAKNAKAVKNDFLVPALQESVIATATSVARSEQVHAPTAKTLSQVIRSINATFEAHKSNDISTLDLQSRMLGLNAAISRFSSQAFSGVPPIRATECHFWIHSLLGTGSANIALSNLVGSIQDVLGAARLPERLIALQNVTDDVPDDKELTMGVDLLNFNIFDRTKGAIDETVPTVPLVTYFSGRDGFSSQLQTLSAPLTTIAECNSFRSNILTATHEISHILVRSALSVLAPSLSSNDEINEAKRIARSSFRARNHIEAARKLVVEAVAFMDAAHMERTLDPGQLLGTLPNIFDRWRKEMQEILVHSFDFLYFHQSQPEFYVTSIWHSWCSIPGIGERVPEYLMRTMCAISAGNLDSPADKIFPSALRSTEELLKKVKSDIDPANDYVQMALDRITEIKSGDELRKRVAREFEARKYLVRLVKCYLHSTTVENDLFRDRTVQSGSARVAKAKLRYDTNHIGNSLNFLRSQLKEKPTEAESIWVLHCLAFDLYRPVRQGS